MQVFRIYVRVYFRTEKIHYNYYLNKHIFSFWTIKVSQITKML